MEERIIKRLMNSVKCSHCGQNYKSQNIKVLGHTHSLWFLSVYCPSCRKHCLLATTISKDKAELITDLTPAETAHFLNSPKLTGDDVLDMHNFLKSFDGDFGHLFGRERVS